MCTETEKLSTRFLISLMSVIIRPNYMIIGSEHPATEDSIIMTDWKKRSYHKLKNKHLNEEK